MRHSGPAGEHGPAPTRNTVLLPTTVVGSYSVPEWLERLKTEYYQRRISAQHLTEIHEVAIKAAVKDQELAGIDIVSDGGPVGDTGLTGRKIIVDTYGGFARHGGGAFSGKDPSKVDRSASYAARHVAKNIVAAGLADRAEVQVAYAIGVARPLSLLIETFGTEKVARPLISELVRDHFDLRPAALVQVLDLRRPIYRRTAAYGHFGRDEPGFTWERTGQAAILRAEAGLG